MCAYGLSRKTTLHVQTGYSRICSSCLHERAIFICIKTQFLLRREAIALYRDALRVVKRLNGTATQREMKDWIRGEFDRWKHNTDEVSLMLWELLFIFTVCLHCRNSPSHCWGKVG